MRPVHRAIDFLGELLDLCHVFDMGRHNHLRARIKGKIRPTNTLGKADGFKSVCARHNNEVWVAPRLKSVANLVKPGLEANCMLRTQVVVKPFRINLVLQVNAGSPRMFKYAHRVDNMGRLAESSSYVA